MQTPSPVNPASGAGQLPATGFDPATHQFRYYDFVMAAFVTVLLLSNVIGASKLSEVSLFGSTFLFGAGILFFPLGYVIGDVLTEIYGFARARRVIWAGFGALVFLAFMSWAVVAMPASAGWWCSATDMLMLKDGARAPSGTGAVCQITYESVFGSTWRIVVASIVGFWAGEFVNSIVLARMKVWTKGKMLWTRTIGSTVFGQAVDSAVFYPVAFLGIWSTEQVITVMITNWLLKVSWEVVLTPVTYAVVGWLKRREGVEVFDTATDFTPFSTRV